MTKRANPLSPKPISEKQIQETADQFLTLEGWRIIRTDPPHLRGLGVQEPGIPDRLYLRYWAGCIDQTAHASPYESWGQILFVEWKRRGGKAPAHQKVWHERERARGALTLIAGEDFQASI